MLQVSSLIKKILAAIKGSIWHFEIMQYTYQKGQKKAGHCDPKKQPSMWISEEPKKH